MGQSHCKEVLNLIHEDILKGLPPAKDHLEELWVEACGGDSNVIDGNRIRRLLTDYLEVALRWAPDQSDMMLGGEFVARFWELAMNRENWKKANMQLMLNIFRRTAEHYVQVFIRSLDDDLSGIVDKDEFIHKISRLLFGQGAPLGTKLGYVGVAAFQKEFKLNSLQVEMLEYTNILEQLTKKIGNLANIDSEDDILIVKCVIKNPSEKTWTTIQQKIEYLLGQVQLDSSTSLDEIGPSIFLGDIQTATDYTELIVNGITHILGIGHYTDEQIKPHFDFTKKFKYLIINDIKDEPAQLILDKIQICHSFLWDCLSSHGRAIIHSSEGTFSPSAVIVLSWLMKTQDMSYDAALNRLRMKRKCVPNIGFECQLRRFQQYKNNTDPSLYVGMDIQESLSQYVLFLCARVPKLRDLLSAGSKVAEELLIISLHLHQVLRIDFDEGIKMNIAFTIEQLRDIQRTLVKNHRSLREFNKLFPKKEFAWVKEYLASGKSQSDILDKEQLDSSRRDSTGGVLSPSLVFKKGDSHPAYFAQSIQMTPLANESEPLMPEENKGPLIRGSSKNETKVQIQRHNQDDSGAFHKTDS